MGTDLELSDPDAKIAKVLGEVDPSTLTAREKQSRAVELARRGYSWDVVARGSGYKNGKTAAATVARVHKRNELHEVEDLRSVQLDRLNRFLASLSPATEAGNSKAIDTALRVMQRIDELAGVNDRTTSVTEHKHVVTVQATEQEFVQAVSMAQPTPLPEGHVFADDHDPDIEDAELID